MYKLMDGGVSMIHNMAVFLVSGCMKQDKLQLYSNAPLKDLNREDITESAVYGLEMIISSIINLLIIFILSIIFGKVLETALFLICFCIFRPYAGGYHAPNYLTCTLIFTCIYCIIIHGNGYISENHCYVFWALSFVSIWILSPVEDPNKPLGEKRYKKVKKKARIILLIETLVFFITIAIGFSLVYTAIVSALSVACFLVLLGQIKLYWKKGF